MLKGGGTGQVQGHTTLPKDSKSRTLPQDQKAFCRGSIRRSLTFPRNIMSRTTGDSVPVSSGSNFVKNIFLTFVRPRGKIKQEKEVEEESFQPFGDLLPAAVGLKNQGNTCYMNSVVQCLSHTDALAKFLVTDAYKRHLRKKLWTKKGKGEVTEEFASILKNAWLRLNSSEEAAVKFKTAVDRGSTQWRGSEEHDAQEFLLWMLGRLHEDLTQSSSKGKQIKRKPGTTEEEAAAEAAEEWSRANHSVIQEIFGAQFRSSLTCPGCGRQSATFEPFLTVSLPIPEINEELPVYVHVMFLSQQPRLVKLGLSLSSTGDMKNLTAALSTDTGIKDILLLEIDGEGFHRTFTEGHPLSAVSRNESLYGLEMPRITEESLVVLWANVLVAEDTRVRFGSPYVSQMSRETTYVDFQKLLLKEMATILKPGILVSEQKAGVFGIRIVDGTADGTLLDPSVPHPLFTEAIEEALGLCTGGIYPHVKILIEWKPAAKEEIIADESEAVEEHLSLCETREKHSTSREVRIELKECFELYTGAEELRGDNSYHCPHCNRKEEGTLKIIGLHTAPQILVLHLKRFRQGTRGSVSKISSLIDFPVDTPLDLGPHVSPRTRPRPKDDGQPHAVTTGTDPHPPSKTKTSFGGWRQRASFRKLPPQPLPKINGFHDEHDLYYDLFAVCNHHGKDLQGGHYTAYCRNPIEKTWWAFDDTRVRELSSGDEIKTSAAYILFYQRRRRVDEPQQGQWVRNLIRKQHKNQRTPPGPGGPDNNGKVQNTHTHPTQQLTTTVTLNRVQPSLLPVAHPPPPPRQQPNGNQRDQEICA